MTTNIYEPVIGCIRIPFYDSRESHISNDGIHKTRTKCEECTKLVWIGPKQKKLKKTKGYRILCEVCTFEILKIWSENPFVAPQAHWILSLGTNNLGTYETFVGAFLLG